MNDLWFLSLAPNLWVPSCLPACHITPGKWVLSPSRLVYSWHSSQAWFQTVYTPIPSNKQETSVWSHSQLCFIKQHSFVKLSLEAGIEEPTTRLQTVPMLDADTDKYLQATSSPNVTHATHMPIYSCNHNTPYTRGRSYQATMSKTKMVSHYILKSISCKGMPGTGKMIGCNTSWMIQKTELTADYFWQRVIIHLVNNSISSPPWGSRARFGLDFGLYGRTYYISTVCTTSCMIVKTKRL